MKINLELFNVSEIRFNGPDDYNSFRVIRRNGVWQAQLFGFYDREKEALHWIPLAKGQTFDSIDDAIQALYDYQEDLVL